MVAFYAKNKPHIYTADVYGSGVSNPAENHYATAGLGATLASFLLSEFAEPKSLGGIAAATSIFVIKKVKENNTYCGGDTTVKMLVPVPTTDWHSRSVGKFNPLPKEFVNLMEKRLVKLDEKTKKSRNKQVNTILQQVGAKVWAEHLKKVKAELKAEEDEERRLNETSAGFTNLNPETIENKGENNS